MHAAGCDSRIDKSQTPNAAMSSGKQGKKAKSSKSKSLKSAQEVQLESFLFGDAASLESDAHLGSELAPSLAASAYGGDDDHENADAEVEEAPAFGFSIDVVGDKRKAHADHGDEDDHDDEDSAASNRGASAAGTHTACLVHPDCLTRFSIYRIDFDSTLESN